MIPKCASKPIWFSDNLACSALIPLHHSLFKNISIYFPFVLTIDFPFPILQVSHSHIFVSLILPRTLEQSHANIPTQINFFLVSIYTKRVVEKCGMSIIVHLPCGRPSFVRDNSALQCCRREPSRCGMPRCRNRAHDRGARARDLPDCHPRLYTSPALGLLNDFISQYIFKIIVVIIYRR